MRVGFYLDTSHLASWNWTDVLRGRVPLSGTDGTTFRIVHALANQSAAEIAFLTTNPGMTPSATPASQITVDDFVEAVHRARAHNLDVLVFNDADRPEVRNGVRLAEQLRQPCIAWCHNGPWRKMAQLYSQLEVIRRVVCVSHVHADLYREKDVFRKIEVVYNGINTQRYRGENSQGDSQTVCYVGALTQSQGFHDLVQAWPRVQDSHPEARLLVVGSPRLYDRSAELGPLGVASPDYERSSLIPYLGTSLEDAEKRFRIAFMGLLSPNQVRDVMQSSLVGVVNPNTQKGALETFCVTAVEMQATETAVVGGRRRGLRETIQNGKTGILIDTSDQLASTLSRLLNQPTKARRMGKRGRKWVSHTFDLSRVVEHWTDLLEATVQGRPPDPPSFSFKRATTKTFLREGIRQIHSLAGEGNRITALDWLLDAVRDAR
jgi:glycosyltransferase involved in cell wall biosynthesis